MTINGGADSSLFKRLKCYNNSNPHCILRGKVFTGLIYKKGINAMKKLLNLALSMIYLLISGGKDQLRQL
jgi:hypothetical protein